MKQGKTTCTKASFMHVHMWSHQKLPKGFAFDLLPNITVHLKVYKEEVLTNVGWQKGNKHFPQESHKNDQSYKIPLFLLKASYSFHMIKLSSFWWSLSLTGCDCLSYSSNDLAISISCFSFAGVDPFQGSTVHA